MDELKRATPMVHYDKKRSAIVDITGRTYSGLCPILMREFYPRYSYQKAQTFKATNPLLNPSQYTGIAPTPLKPPPKRKGSSPKTKEKGMKLGIRVDNELTKVVGILVETKVTVKKHITNLMKSPDPIPIHRRTYLILRKLAQLRLRPIGSQVPVNGTRVATFLDLLCIHELTGVYVVVQNKSGFERYHNNGSGSKLSAPYAAHSDCPRHQHHLQLFSEMTMTSHTFSLHGDKVSGLLIRVDDNKCSVEELLPWISSSTEGVNAVRKAVLGS